MTRVKKDTGHVIEISPGAKGAVSEHLATAWLLRHGYDVFRNVSPNGKADLLAVNWDKDETVRVDVKSKGFCLTGAGPRAVMAKQTDRRNAGFEIKYLVVDDAGGCEWYVEKPVAVNDNIEGPQMWTGKVTMQRFQMPGVDMSKKSWLYFCYWVLKHCPEHIKPMSEDFVRDLAVRGQCHGTPYVSPTEFTVLEKLRRQVFDKLSADGRVIGVSQE